MMQRLLENSTHQVSCGRSLLQKNYAKHVTKCIKCCNFERLKLSDRFQQLITIKQQITTSAQLLAMLNNEHDDRDVYEDEDESENEEQEEEEEEEEEEGKEGKEGKEEEEDDDNDKKKEAGEEENQEQKTNGDGHRRAHPRRVR
jgi:stringent starvation protein B